METSATATATARAITDVQLLIEPHPLLALDAFETRYPASLSEITCTETLMSLLTLEATAPVTRSEAVRAAVRDLLRHGGYKPTGRGKPASEYLAKAAADGLRAINVAVDACNAVSLHSGLPVSVIDLDRAEPPLRVAAAAVDAAYVFNASGQEIRVGGLICLHDAVGPCANAVKDSQRTKTDADTRRTLSLIWGPKAHAEHVSATGRWYRRLLCEAGGDVLEVDG